MEDNLLEKEIDSISTSLNLMKTEDTNTISFDFDNLSFPLKEHFSSNGFLLVLFINPLSGSQEGNTILNLSQEHKDKSIPDYNVITFNDLENEITQSEILENGNDMKFSFHPAPYNAQTSFSTIIFNILNKKDFEKGKNFIIDYLNNYEKNFLKILIGGGDGTTLRLIEDLYDKKINLSKCIFGSIPLGTGNDLSNATGFGNTVQIGNKIKYLHRILYTYFIAEECKIDIWEIITKIKAEGSINDIISYGERIKCDNQGRKLLLFKKSFINYMSIGFDAKIGYNFERNRSNSRCMNKFVYFWESFKRYICCQSDIYLNQVLEGFYVIDECEDNDLNNNNLDHKLNNNNILNNSIDYLEQAKKKIIFGVLENEDLSEKQIKEVILKDNPVDMICQNINFYMGGTRNIWGNSSHIAIKIADLQGDEYKKYKKEILKQYNSEQKYDDKIIEFFTYGSGIKLALERFNGGYAQKLYQGKGPFIFKFKSEPNYNEIEYLNKVYLNVDGEFFHLKQPESLIIRLNKKICDGQINFLRNTKGL